MNQYLKDYSYLDNVEHHTRKPWITFRSLGYFVILFVVILSLIILRSLF